MRYSNTERLGVFEVGKIVTKNIGWIFREQTTSDVGIDAIIEQVDNNNPTGKLIAIQIKSGKGNFHISENKITYYASNIHYNYWLSLNIPVLLVAHLPETEETFWIEISETTFIKTNKKWKLEIPLNHKFNEQSKKRLTKILESKNESFKLYDIDTDDESIFDLTEKVECIGEAVTSVNKIVEIITELRMSTVKFNSKLSEFNERELNIKSPQVSSSLKGFGRILNISSKRLENEIELFSNTFSEGIISYERVTHLYFSLAKDLSILELFKESIKGIPNATISAIEGIETMRNGVENLNKIKLLNEPRKTLLNVIDLLIYELKTSGEITTKIITNK
ncbi:DUF4365 domain-containing protein [Cellulophaga sp. E16_2]|uniref:DUF4365 domain-containing protein n=1 Tax=Cellulophaga sp. E16_2 TaxID=2789297 RepID=UPI001A937BC4|nr:DUF4365 domain-containing protein [Cellulophaga sp. E16_2]MBO0591224.1 DUF4365 domain-containing protein [Cellulophaga sp. E16_2]